MKNLYLVQLPVMIVLLSGAPGMTHAQQTETVTILNEAEQPATGLAPEISSTAEQSQLSTDDITTGTAVDETSGTESVPEDTPTQTSQTITRYTELVYRLESESGAYNHELVEQLIGLGLAYSDAGNHAEALKVYERALHIQRVNQGLPNIEQIAVLERVIDAHTALNNYEELIDNYDYMLWVYKRNYGDNDVRLLPVLDRIANWHIDAFNHTYGPQSLGHLVIAANLFNESLETITLTRGEDHPDMIRPLYGIVNANFKLIEPFGYIEGIDMYIGGRAMPLLPDNFSRVNDDNYLRNSYIEQNYGGGHLARILDGEKDSASLVQNSYRSGRAALEKIIVIHEKNPDLSRKSHAYALAQLGDWFQRFTKRDASTRYYRQAYALLAEDTTNTTGLSELFGRPVSLDALNVPKMIEASQSTTASAAPVPETIESIDMTEKTDVILQQLAADELQDSNYVLVQFDVSASGLVRNLEFISSNPEDDSRLRRMARERINITPFRPRLENGQPIGTEDVKMVYTFQE